jgi:hypothetical protein
MRLIFSSIFCHPTVLAVFKSVYSAFKFLFTLGRLYVHVITPMQVNTTDQTKFKIPQYLLQCY